MLSRIQSLVRLPLFANLTFAELADLVAHLTEACAPPGTTLIAEGAPPGTPLFVLLEGTVATVKRTAHGQSHTVGNQCGPSVFGEMDVLAGRPAHCSVVALGRVHYATLTGEALRELCEAGRPCVLKVLTNLTTALRYRTLALEFRLRTVSSATRVGAMRHMLYSGWDTRRRA